MSILDKDRNGPAQSRQTGNEALREERRVDPGRLDRNPERVNGPSRLSPIPPKGRDNTGMRRK